MRIVILAITVIILVGCGTPLKKFEMNKADVPVTGSQNSLYLSQNNRISTTGFPKTIGFGTVRARGVIIDDSGVFLDPYVEKDLVTGQIITIGFNITNKTRSGGILEEFGPVQKLVFRLPDGQVINMKVTSQISNTASLNTDTDSYNIAARHITESFQPMEIGMAEISKDSFKKLASVQSFSCLISGPKITAFYDEDDIAPEFLHNIKAFYEAYVK